MTTPARIRLVRIALGDTDVEDEVFATDDIRAVLESEPVITRAAAILADSAAARFAREVDRRIGPTSVSASQQSQAYAALAARLRASPPGDFAGGVHLPVPYAGGLDAPLQFGIGMDDFTSTGSQSDDLED